MNSLIPLAFDPKHLKNIKYENGINRDILNMFKDDRILMPSEHTISPGNFDNLMNDFIKNGLPRVPSLDWNLLDSITEAYKLVHPCFDDLKITSFDLAISEMTSSSSPGFMFKRLPIWKPFNLKDKSRFKLDPEMQDMLKQQVKGIFLGEDPVEIWTVAPKYEIRSNEKIFNSDDKNKERTFMVCSPLMYVVCHMLCSDMMDRLVSHNQRNGSTSCLGFVEWYGGVGRLYDFFTSDNEDYSDEYISSDSSANEASFTPEFMLFLFDKFVCNFSVNQRIDIMGEDQSDVLLWLRNGLKWMIKNNIDKLVKGPDGNIFRILGKLASGFLLTLLFNTLGGELNYFYARILTEIPQHEWSLPRFCQLIAKTIAAMMGDDSLARLPKIHLIDKTYVSRFLANLCTTGFIYTLEAPVGGILKQKFLNRSFAHTFLYGNFLVYFKPNLDKLMSSLALKTPESQHNRTYAKLAQIYQYIFPMMGSIGEDQEYDKHFHDVFRKLVDNYYSLFEAEIISESLVDKDCSLLAVKAAKNNLSHRFLMKLHFGIDLQV